jgi:FkbM family methyltransferase
MLKIFKKIIPSKFYLKILYFWRLFSKKLDPEMLLIRNILIKKRRFLDVGSNIGIYSYFFSKFFSKVDAFEPILINLRFLKALKNSKLKLHNIGCSNKKGNLKIYIPLVNGVRDYTLASIEKRQPPFIKKNITINTIDYFNFHDVDLIKIDVEGHEKSVLVGAIKTIKRCRPLLLIEIEQRHIKQPINKIFDFISNLKYKGYFILQKKIIKINQFSYEIHQKPNENNVTSKFYINNFIFIPEEEKILDNLM